MDHELDASLSPEETSGIPELDAALGVSSNSPCMNGHAKEEGEHQGIKENTDAGVTTSIPLFLEGAEEEVSPTENYSIEHSFESSSNADSVSKSLVTAGNSGGPKKPKVNRGAANQSKSFPFMGYQILPIIPQPVLFPVMPKNQYSQLGTTSHQPDPLSTTNLYIKGLPENCTDEDLEIMCNQYGKIVSTKAILDKKTGICKGYGFVDFSDPSDAQKAVDSLISAGRQAQFAKLQEQDPTNLYMSNLPKNYSEKTLEQMLSPFGTIISTRILRDIGGLSRGVGFVRLDSHENCVKAIEKLSGVQLSGSIDPLNIKFADGSTNKKKLTGTWKEVDFMGWKEYNMPDFMYDSIPMIAPSNGYVNPRAVPSNVTYTNGYHQMQAGTNSSAPSWQNHRNTTYYISNPMNGTDHSVHNLATQMNSLQLAPPQTPNGSTNARSVSTPTGCPPPMNQTHYTQQPPGWTIRVATNPPQSAAAHFIHQQVFVNQFLLN